MRFSDTTGHAGASEAHRACAWRITQDTICANPQSRGKCHAGTVDGRRSQWLQKPSLEWSQPGRAGLEGAPRSWRQTSGRRAASEAVVVKLVSKTTTPKGSSDGDGDERNWNPCDTVTTSNLTSRFRPSITGGGARSAPSDLRQQIMRNLAGLHRGLEGLKPSNLIEVLPKFELVAANGGNC